MTTSVFEMLDGEWGRLRRDKRAARRLREVCAVAGDATSLEGVEAYVRRARPEGADAVLLALVRRAVAGDTLAARVLLQLLLPGTRNLARRWWALGDHEERAAAAVTAVWQRICGYPVARRPGRVAANILMDAARELRRAVPRVVVTLSDEPGPEPRGGEPAAVELAEVLLDAVADGVLEREDAMLIARSRIAGQRVADIAAHRQLSGRTLWDRRQRAERALVAAHDHDRGPRNREACA
jgi:hypothetical protein